MKTEGVEIRMVVCPECNQSLEYNEANFPKRYDRANGLRRTCKKCFNRTRNISRKEYKANYAKNARKNPRVRAARYKSNLKYRTSNPKRHQNQVENSWRKFVTNHPEEAREKYRKRSDRECKNIGNNYVKHLLRKEGFSTEECDRIENLIEVKRSQVKLRREINKKSTK